MLYFNSSPTKIFQNPKHVEVFLADFDETRLMRFLLLTKYTPLKDFFFNDTFRWRKHSNFKTARKTIFSALRNIFTFLNRYMFRNWHDKIYVSISKQNIFLRE